MVLIYRVRMNDGVAARTDGVNIYLDDRLSPVQEKCAIAHEAIHIERGHGTLQREEVEMSVRYETAQRLLPSDIMAGRICRDAADLKTAAAALEVTRQVLMDRAVTLTRDQSIAAGCFSCLKCPSQAAKMREFVNSMATDRAYREHPRVLARTAVAA